MSDLINLIDAIESILQQNKQIPLEKKTELHTILADYSGDLDELNPFIQFDASRNYTRNLISTDNETYALMLLCWNQGKYSPIHDHPTNGCWVKVIQGQVNEVRYIKHETKLKEVSNITMSSGVSYMHNSLGLHKIGNPSSDMDAITMHLYAPPYDKCRIWFDTQDIEKSSIAISSYYSVLGERVEL